MMSRFFVLKLVLERFIVYIILRQPILLRQDSTLN